MLTDKIRALFQRGNDEPLSAANRVRIPGSLSKHAQKTGLSEARASRGLEQFFFNLRDSVGLTILDLAVPNQDNISFLTNLGHKLYTADLIGCLDDAFGKNPGDQTNAGRIDYFLRSSLDYPPETFDAVLLWDGLQFMGPALLAATVDRLYDIMRPDGYLLAFVTANERVTE
ncbi:MAG: hypothetical protein JWN34_1058, partial [Bryobacterales bacterium]|nr:hypothetical protein [Bryobacterales bacterium]